MTKSLDLMSKSFAFWKFEIFQPNFSFYNKNVGYFQNSYDFVKKKLWFYDIMSLYLLKN